MDVILQKLVRTGKSPSEREGVLLNLLFLCLYNTVYGPLTLFIDGIAVRGCGSLIQAPTFSVGNLLEVIAFGYAVSVIVNPGPTGEHTSKGVIGYRVQIEDISVCVGVPAGGHNGVPSEMEPVKLRLSLGSIRIRIQDCAPLIRVGMVSGEEPASHVIAEPCTALDYIARQIRSGCVFGSTRCGRFGGTATAATTTVGTAASASAAKAKIDISVDD